MKKKEILLVVNPISGNIDKDDIIPEIEAAVIKSGATLKIYKTTGIDDLNLIKGLLLNYHPERVIAAGGDGTIKLATEAIRDHNIPLGIIPAGSANGLALNLKLPTTLQAQLEVALGNNAQSLDVLDINGEVCLHLADLGINAELIQNYEASSVRGKFGYLLQSIPTLIKSKYPFDFEIETENRSLRKQGILLAFANFNKYGTGANINPKGKPDDGIFEIVVFKNFDIIEILKTLRNEEDLDPDFAEIIPAKKARIYCKNPVAFQVDGEYLGELQEINVKIIPQKLRVFQ